MPRRNRYKRGGYINEYTRPLYSIQDEVDEEVEEITRIVWSNKESSTGLPPITNLARCSHQRSEVNITCCRNVVEYEVSRTLYCSAWNSLKNGEYSGEAIDRIPDLTVWLDPAWTRENFVWVNSWDAVNILSDEPSIEIPSVYIKWPDMQTLPVDNIAPIVLELADRVRDDWKIEIGCIGGHGRTGTMACLLMVSLGYTADDAIRIIRKDYCASAVETKAQEEMVSNFEEYIRGLDLDYDYATK